MENKRRRCTDKGIEQDPVRSAFGTLERRLKEGEDEFKYRKPDDQVFRMLVERAANKFALRVEETIEGSSGGEDGEPLGPTSLREEVSGGGGERGAVEFLLMEALSRSGLGYACGDESEKPQDHESQKAAEAAESTEAALVRYKGQYDALPGEVKSRCTWEELSSRLSAKEGHYLKLAMAMQDKGKLVFIDKGGNPIFRDGGVEPVMKGMNYNDAREALYGKDYEEGTPHFGYEMPDGVDEIRAIEKFTKKPFVASDNGKEWRSTWMESKKNPSFARDAVFIPDNGCVGVCVGNFPNSEGPRRGVVRLLRVKKMA